MHFVRSGLVAACLTTMACVAVGQVETRDFPIMQPIPELHGGLFAHDLDSDGRLDFVVISEGHIGAYRQSGVPLWVRRCDVELFDSSHHPSAIAGDLDGDGEQEVAYLTGAGEIAILDGATGAPERALEPPRPPDAIAIANLRGDGDREILLQFSQTEIAAISAADGSLLWETDEYRGIEHSPLRQVDLDGDGLDEVAGASIIDHDGTKMNDWDLGGAYLSMDSIAVADVVPGGPLEVVLAEQRGANSHTDMVNHERILFRALNPWNWEDPDKVTVGDFDPSRPGLEILNRSSGGDGTARRGDEEPYRNELAPWVLDAEGGLICKYYVNDHKPEWWTGHGIEEIAPIDWDGDAIAEIAAKERHAEGAGAIINPMTCEFLEVFEGQAARLYVVDLGGDSREEVVILDQRGFIRVIRNGAPNLNPAKPSPWTRQHYRRQKQNWNYYSP